MKTFYEIYTSVCDAFTEAWIDRRVDINLCVDISESGIIVEDYLDLELTEEYMEHFWVNPYLGCTGFICEELCNSDITHFTSYDEYGNVLGTSIHAYRNGKMIEVNTLNEEE